MAVSVLGTGFQRGAGLAVSFGAGITVDSVSYVSSFELQAHIVVADDAEFGERTVTVTNPDHESASRQGAFEVTEFDPHAGFLWVADGFSNTLYKMRISDTTIVQTWDILEVAPGGSPQGLAFDGHNLWLSAGGTDDQIMKIDTAGGALTKLSFYTAPPNAEGVVRDLAFDDSVLWVANSGSAHIYKTDPVAGVVLDSIPTPGAEVRGIVVANGTLYCNDRTLDSVYAYNPLSGTWTAAFAIPIPPNGTTANRYSTGMTFDGVNFWIANSTFEFDYIFQVSLDGTLLKPYEVPNRGDAAPAGIVFTQN